MWKLYGCGVLAKPFLTAAGRWVAAKARRKSVQTHGKRRKTVHRWTARGRRREGTCHWMGIRRLPSVLKQVVRHQLWRETLKDIY